MILGDHGGPDPPLGCIAISHAGHCVPFLRATARFGGGIDGCVLIRSSNRAILQPNFRTAVQAGRNGDGCVLIRSALLIGRPIAAPVAPVGSSRYPKWTTRQTSKWSNWEISAVTDPLGHPNWRLPGGQPPVAQLAPSKTDAISSEPDGGFACLICAKNSVFCPETGHYYERLTWTLTSNNTQTVSNAWSQKRPNIHLISLNTPPRQHLVTTRPGN